MNAVESYWRQCKEPLKWMYGVGETMLDSYLDQFQWRQQFGLVVERVPEFSGTRPEPDLFWATRTRLFQVGYVPDPTRTRPFEPKHKIWSIEIKKVIESQIFNN